MQLYPGENFIITRQIDDPIDTKTYYVRATIRNARTDDVIDTVDLVDRGDQRFSVAWLVPPLPYAGGYHISITTKVYTDSGYTTLEPYKSIEEKLYLVEARLRLDNLGFAIPDIDYNKIGKIVSDRVGKQPKIKEEKTDISPIVEQLKAINREMVELYKNLPKGETIDLTLILDAIKRTENHIEDKIKIINPEPVKKKKNKKVKNALEDHQINQVLDKIFKD